MSNTAAILTAAGLIELQERPLPAPGEGEAVVRIRSVGVSVFDVACFRDGGMAVPVGAPVLGQEATGEVVEVGRGVTTVSAGDRVIVEPATPCGECVACRRGDRRRCARSASWPPSGHGSLVHYAAVDEWQLYRLAGSLSFDDGVLITPLAMALRAVQQAQLRLGDSVLIAGAGPVGLLAAEAARALGADPVRLTDVSELRRGIAAGHGFAVEPAPPEDREVDVLIGAGDALGFARGLASLADGGRAVIVGVDTPDTTVTLSGAGAREISVARVHRYQPAWLLAIELASTGRIGLEGIVTHAFGLGDTAEALRTASGEGAMKVVVHPGEA